MRQRWRRNAGAIPAHQGNEEAGAEATTRAALPGRAVAGNQARGGCVPVSSLVKRSTAAAHRKSAEPDAKAAE